jgi:hypothetical protein
MGVGQLDGLETADLSLSEMVDSLGKDISLHPLDAHLPAGAQCAQR